MTATITMVTIDDKAVDFINDLLAKNGKEGYGIKIYFSGMACSGPQFGMSFAQDKGDLPNEIAVKGFSFYFDDETKEALEPCVIEYVEDPNFGNGLAIRDPNAKGCSSCGGGCH